MNTPRNSYSSSTKPRFRQRSLSKTEARQRQETNKPFRLALSCSLFRLVAGVPSPTYFLVLLPSFEAPGMAGFSRALVVLLFNGLLQEIPKKPFPRPRTRSRGPDLLLLRPSALPVLTQDTHPY